MNRNAYPSYYLFSLTACRHLNPSQHSARRRRPLPSLTQRKERVSSESTDSPSLWSSPRSSDGRSTSQSWLLVKTSSREYRGRYESSRDSYGEKTGRQWLSFREGCMSGGSGGPLQSSSDDTTAHTSLLLHSPSQHRRHPSPSLWWWTHFASLRHPTGHRQGLGCLLRQVLRCCLCP